MEKILISFSVICTLIGLYKFVIYRFFAKVDKYEWLDLLDCENWKSGPYLNREMEFRKNWRWIAPGTVYCQLSQLEEEGLIESKDIETETRIVSLFRKKYGKRRN